MELDNKHKLFDIVIGQRSATEIYNRRLTLAEATFVLAETMNIEQDNAPMCEALYAAMKTAYTLFEQELGAAIEIRADSENVLTAVTELYPFSQDDSSMVLNPHRALAAYTACYVNGAFPAFVDDDMKRQVRRVEAEDLPEGYQLWEYIQNNNEPDDDDDSCVDVTRAMLVFQQEDVLGSLLVKGSYDIESGDARGLDGEKLFNLKDIKIRPIADVLNTAEVTEKDQIENETDSNNSIS